MKLIVLFFIILINSYAAMAQEKFIKACENRDELYTVYSEKDETMNALKDFYGTKDCLIIAKKLSSIKSFNEFIPPSTMALPYDNLLFPWTDDFPHLYGLKDTYSYKIKGFDNSPDGYNANDMYQDLDIFAEFTNIKAISLVHGYKYYIKDPYSTPFDVCQFISKFPHLRTITIESDLLMDPEIDDCLSNSKIDGVIIRNKFKGYDGFLPKTKIIGIEFYKGDLNHLIQYRYLKYLGISNETTALDGVEALSFLTNLTHFSMNIKSIQNISEIGNLKNLTYLNLTCIDNEKAPSPSDQSCKSGFALSKIDFLKGLRWLDHLNLSFSSIQDIGDLTNLKKLSYLKLRGNNITGLSNISKLSKLTYLDLSGNQIEDIQGIVKLPELKFLNLSGNKVRDLSPLKSLNKLEFLNLSNTASVTINESIFPTSLRGLNLNGGGGSTILHIEGFERYKQTLPPNSGNEYVLEQETLFHDFASFQKGCAVSPQLNEMPDLSHLKKLEVLTLKNNQLSKMTDIKHLGNLKYLNLARNEMTALSADLLPTNLKFIDYSVNQLQAFPALSALPNLKRIELSLNDIVALDNVAFLPESVTKVGLKDNLIQDVDILVRFSTRQRPFVNGYETSGNPIQKNSFLGRSLLPQTIDSTPEKHNNKKCPEAAIRN